MYIYVLVMYLGFYSVITAAEPCPLTILFVLCIDIRLPTSLYHNVIVVVVMYF